MEQVEKRNWPHRFYQKYREIILYGLIGSSGAILDFILFLIFTRIFNWDPILATALSVSAGIINNFLLNSWLNYKTHDQLLKRFLLFYLIGLIGVITSMAIIYLLHNLMSVDDAVAKLISIPIVVVGQFIANRSITFAKAKTSGDDNDN